MIIIILLAIALIGAVATAFHYRNQRVEIIEINQARQQENEKIEEDIKRRREQLFSIQDQINQQDFIIQNLRDSANELRATAEKQAKENARAVFTSKLEELNLKYKIEEDKANSALVDISRKIKQESEKLKGLEDKQLAYIRAQQRQEEIEANQDYYRLVVDEEYKDDIQLLRDIQKRMIKKEPVDKVIWEVYYRPAYDILMSHLFQSKDKVSGIYRITSLTTGKSYIGQSVDMRERARQHIKSSLTYGPKTNKLYQEMSKYGPDNFTFEILEEVSKDKLNEREKYWIEFYHTKEQLNSTAGGA